MRAAVLTHRLPWPPHGGGDLRNWQNVKALAGLGGVGVLALSRETEAPDHPGILSWRCSADRSLEHLPEATPAETLRWLRDPDGHPSDRWLSPVAAAELRELVERVEPDVVLVEHLWLHRYIPVLRELGCRVVLDAHNLEGPLHSDLAGDRREPLSALFAKRAIAIEAAAFESVDQVWLCSEEDARRAGELYPSAAPAIVVPNTIDVDRYARAERPAPGASLLYTAAFEYPPNRRAARRLIEEIFPQLAARRPDARLALVGSNPTPAMSEAGERDRRIEVTGSVEDTVPFFRDASAMPIPLDEGGGTRFKALEAFAAGLAVVSTAKGVEGLGIAAGEHYMEAETTEQFVDALLALLDDAALREGLTARALSMVRERYSHAVAGERIRAAIAGLGLLAGEEEVVDVAARHRAGVEAAVEERELIALDVEVD